MCEKKENRFGKYYGLFVFILYIRKKFGQDFESELVCSLMHF